MAEGYIVVDIPESCGECEIMFGDEYSYCCPAKQKEDHSCEVYEFYKNKTRPDWCPIKELPELESELGTYQEDWLYVEGYSTCLKEIFGDD